MKSVLVSTAYARYVRVSPRKVRQVLDLIRGEKINQALAILTNINKKAKVSVEKVLKSALSNAKQNPQVLVDELFISKITADKGPTLKRYRAAAMGRATMIRHRTSHLRVELARKPVKPTKTIKKETVKGAAKRKTQKRRIRR